ncbi:VOC family protein [uncultured Demequina sp.]|uniref:VOC family protein n=1 Tax=uncultured Demequina sp. TaxID=693499 RepID=UPI0025F444C3|nr:VOC family protein [uncultured Demequina sp.]
MLGASKAQSSFSTDSAAQAHEFYTGVLGLEAEMIDEMGPMVLLHHPHGSTTLIYEKEGHEPASHTVLMFEVDDIDVVANGLREKGVVLEQLEWTDEDGVARDPEGRMPSTLWFKDPAGNWLSAMEATDA